MNTTLQEFAALRCRTFDCLAPGALPRVLVVLNHGFGAPGDDLADFGPMLLESSAAIASICRFAFPEAPIDLAPLGMPGGRAWWPINMAKLAEMNLAQDFSELTRLNPPGMEKAATQLANCVHAMLHDAGESCRLVLGGFSQGAMVSTHATLTQQLAPSSLLLFSGTLLWSDEWTRLAVSHPGTVVLQSHGTEDPILPFDAAKSLADLLNQATFNVEFVSFRGPHTIPMPVLSRVQRHLEELAASI